MKEMLRIAASSDIHSPKNLDLFRASAHRLKEADLLILAGDLIYKGRVSELDHVIEAVTAHFSGPVVACFGNEEFDEVKEELKDRSRGVITWLDDEALTLNIKGYIVGLIGTRGCLDQPTSWQLRNIPGIRELYEKRVETVDRLLAELKGDFRILFSHYALLRETLKGENPRIWPQLGCSRMIDVLKRRRPSVAIHGHVHNGKLLKTKIDGTLVLNVSLPATNEIVFFTLPPYEEGQPPLTSFF